MERLSIDIETYSSVNLQKCGIYQYAESDNFEILLFGYAIDGGEVQVVDLAKGEQIPDTVLKKLLDEKVQKWAFNAQFERICLSRYLGFPTGAYLPPEGWYCTMVWSAYMGLPQSLESVGTVLGLARQKLSEGKNLIRYFCVPCKPTKANGGRTRNLPEHGLEKWERFKAYNMRDVDVEQQIQKRLSKFPVPDVVWEEYHQNEEINDRGIRIDRTFVDQAVAFDTRSKEELTKTMKKLTALENPNSVQQLKDWLVKQGVETNSLDKKAVIELLEHTDGVAHEVLKLRKKSAKSSVKKYIAMQNAMNKDDRARGMFRFYGANRTGRFSGRLIQLQNLAQNHMPDLKEARDLVRSGNYEALEMLYDSTPQTLSELLRTAFIPKEGKRFIVADFSAIEARVLSWLAGEKWRTEVFTNGGDIYCASASKMFKVPVEKHGINGHLRQKGKIAELALGYGGAVGALKAMGALEMGLSEEELQPLVDSWRAANPHIVQLWWDVDHAVKACIKERVLMKVQGIQFLYKNGMLFVQLPCGRNLVYAKPNIGENKFGGESVVYWGMGATKKWEKIESYGPKFVENIVQGISRDILCFAMQNLKGYDIVAHVHDEVIIEADKKTTAEEICQVMSRTPSWAEELQLRADGYTCEFYRKE